jgi:hypothetical protein
MESWIILKIGSTDLSRTYRDDRWEHNQVS